MGGAALGLLSCALLFVFVVYGWVGEWMIRSRVLPRVEKRLGRTVEVGTIEVRRGHVVLTDLEVSGPHDDGAPLLHVDRIEADVGFWASLTGTPEVGAVSIEGVKVAAVRTADGDNFSDIAARLRGDGGDTGGGGSGGGKGGSLSHIRPDSVSLRGARLELDDQADGITVVSDGVVASARRGQPMSLTLGSVVLLTKLGPYAQADGVTVTADPDRPLATATVKIGGGQVHLWRGMVLTGLSGSVSQGQLNERPHIPNTTAGSFSTALPAHRRSPSANPDVAGHMDIDITGGYGGAPGTLWRAAGWIDPLAPGGHLQVKADRFTFDRIAPVLKTSMVRDFDKTSIDALLTLDLQGSMLRYSGQVDLTGLNLFHPMLAENEIHDLNLRGDLAGSFDRHARILRVDKAELTSRGVTYGLSGTLAMRGGVLADGSRRVARRLEARVTVPPTPCQEVLDSIPAEMVPHLAGFKLRGTFSTDVHVAIDWADLEALELGGSVGIRHCRVIKPPHDMDARRLEQSFDHEIEIAPDKWKTVTLGPENPDFVPIDQISPYLVKSIMTTEDSEFYRHHGFIVREFRTALIKNLQAGYFKYGASSITMQMVKNVLLYREKTLARKFQELFLTWYVESVLSKDRILEIYLNAIEYGPALYGIGPAAQQYFGIPAFQLNPVQAAFFSSILPAPKRRFKQFCRGHLSHWTQGKIQRILGLMYKRERLTLAEYQLALVTPLVFQPDKRGFCDRKFPAWGIR